MGIDEDQNSAFWVGANRNETLFVWVGFVVHVSNRVRVIKDQGGWSEPNPVLPSVCFFLPLIPDDRQGLVYICTQAGSSRLH